MGKADGILEGLAAAIAAENEGHYFYKMAAAATTDPRGKEVFERLAGEELEHRHFLQAQFQSFKESGKADKTAALGRPSPLIGHSPIFSDDLVRRAGQAHFEMTSLSVGIQLEHAAIQHYQKQARAAANREVKAFYAKLADWEKGHYEALLRQQETLKGDYWAANQFAPF